MQVTRQKGCLETTRGRVQNDAPRNQERCEPIVHASKSFDRCSTSEQKHGGYNDVCAKAEEEKGAMSCPSPSGFDDLSDSVSRRSNLLEVDGNDTEQDDLDCGTRCIPERSPSKRKKLAKVIVVGQGEVMPIGNSVPLNVTLTCVPRIYVHATWLKWNFSTPYNHHLLPHLPKGT